MTRPATPRATSIFTPAEIDQLRTAKSVSEIMAHRDVIMTSTEGELPQTTKVLEVSGNTFSFLGAPPIMGRTFTAAEAPQGSAPPAVAVISYVFWKTHFASDPAIIGKTLELDHQKYTVIGVVGPRFTWHDSEVYIPLPPSVDPKERLETLIRFRPGVSTTALTSEMKSFVVQFDKASPGMLPKEGYTIKVETLNDSLLGEFKGTLFLLFVAVALLLLIGCGNVSILMLARGTARQQELAMRSALGASRVRIVRQLLTESVVVSIAGAALGIAVAYLAIHLIIGLLPEYSIPHEVVIAINLPVLVLQRRRRRRYWNLRRPLARAAVLQSASQQRISNRRHAHHHLPGRTRSHRAHHLPDRTHRPAALGCGSRHALLP